MAFPLERLVSSMRFATNKHNYDHDRESLRVRMQCKLPSWRFATESIHIHSPIKVPHIPSNVGSASHFHASGSATVCWALLLSLSYLWALLLSLSCLYSHFHASGLCYTVCYCHFHAATVTLNFTPPGSATPALGSATAHLFSSSKLCYHC